MNSNFFNLNWSDLVKGFVMAVLTALLTSVYQVIQSGALPTLAQLKVSGLAALVAGIAYLIKNLLSNDSGQFLKK
jgi:hypothetical protein